MPGLGSLRRSEKKIQRTLILHTQARRSLFKSPEVSVKAFIDGQSNGRFIGRSPWKKLWNSINRVTLLLPPRRNIWTEATSIADCYPAFCTVSQGCRRLFASKNGMLVALQSCQLLKPCLRGHTSHRANHLDLPLSARLASHRGLCLVLWLEPFGSAKTSFWHERALGLVHLVVDCRLKPIRKKAMES